MKTTMTMMVALAALTGCATPQGGACGAGGAIGCVASAWMGGRPAASTPGQAVRDAIDRNERAGGVHQEYPCFDAADSHVVQCPPKEGANVQR